MFPKKTYQRFSVIMCVHLQTHMAIALGMIARSDQFRILFMYSMDWPMLMAIQLCGYIQWVRKNLTKIPKTTYIKCSIVVGYLLPSLNQGNIQRAIERDYLSLYAIVKIFIASKYFMNISEELNCLSQCWHEVIQMFFYSNEYWQKLSTKQWNDKHWYFSIHFLLIIIHQVHIFYITHQSKKKKKMQAHSQTLMINDKFRQV